MSDAPPPPPPLPNPDPTQPPPAAPTSAGSFFSDLFDVSMRRMITPSIIKILYVLGIVMVSMIAMFFLVASISNDQVIAGIIFAPLYWFFGIIWIRVLLELVLVLFQIERNTRQPG